MLLTRRPSLRGGFQDRAQNVLLVIPQHTMRKSSPYVRRWSMALLLSGRLYPLNFNTNQLELAIQDRSSYYHAILFYGI